MANDRIAPSWSWASWSGPVIMGSFMAECDPYNPKISLQSLTAAKNGHCRELEIMARVWPAKPKEPAIFTILEGENAYPWISNSWWTFSPFDKPIDDQLRGRICLEISLTQRDGREFQGHVFFDDDSYPKGVIPVPPEVVCIGIHTETVKHNLDESRAACGIHILVVQSSKTRPGKYERLGVGIAIQDANIREVFGFWPSTSLDSIILV
jgi:hypothetical protein